MRRLFFTVLPLLILVLAACQTAPPRNVQAQALVDESKITLEYFKTRNKDSTALFLSTLQDAKGVLIFPDIFQAGVGLGGSGGKGVMLVRKADGSWGQPAFYDFGGASLGIQLGVQSTEVVFLLMSERAVDAVITSPGQIGFDTQATFGQLSAGDVSSTTTKGANIVGFTKGAGLYAGASLSGGGLTPKRDWNEAYYGQSLTPQEIMVEGKASNGGADPLRQALVVR
jgi:lipid-binding SYLF domain-containing protein